jgi:hypothetical protein
MTIEIRQLVIRAEVHPGHDSSPSNLLRAGSTASPFETGPPHPLGEQALREEDVVATCVRTVLRRLERSRER